MISLFDVCVVLVCGVWCDAREYAGDTPESMRCHSLHDVRGVVCGVVCVRCVAGAVVTDLSRVSGALWCGLV